MQLYRHSGTECQKGEKMRKITRGMVLLTVLLFTLNCRLLFAEESTETGEESCVVFEATDGGSFILGESQAVISCTMSHPQTEVTITIKSLADDTVYSKTISNVQKGEEITEIWDGEGAEPGTYTAHISYRSIHLESDPLVIRTQEFAGGTGSEANPFQVDTFERLKLLEKYNGNHFIQTADIDCSSENYKGMFSDSNPMRGTYDGQGKTISNLFLVNPDSETLALFNAVGTDGNLQNIVLEKVYLTAENGAVLVYRNYGKIKNCTLRECNASITDPDGSSGNNPIYAAVLCLSNREEGTITGVSVIGCSVSAYKVNWRTCAGGIVCNNRGKLLDSKIENTVISSKADYYDYGYAGGISYYNNGNMINNIADGVSITAKDSGGLCYDNEGLISQCSFLNGTASETGVFSNTGIVN